MARQISAQEIKQFQKLILDWYAVNKRDLSWRLLPYDTSLQQRDPYKILLSEVMAQQTQISRVITKYEAWLEAFPTINDLANAPVSEVLRLWSGLGYNRRALNLKKLAEIIVTQHEGKFPRDEKELLKLPGIGQYTARALLCFAFNQQIAVVDTNVRKVIITHFSENPKSEARNTKQIQNTNNKNKKRLENFNFENSKIVSSFDIRHSDFSSSNNTNTRVITESEIQTIATQVLPRGLAYEWNQALMDYASAMLKDQKIPIPKQSKFKGSHRYYRGQVLKTLLEKKQLTLPELGSYIRKDYEEVWLQNLVSELRDEGFITIENETISLA